MKERFARFLETMMNNEVLNRGYCQRKSTGLIKMSSFHNVVSVSVMERTQPH